MFDGSMVVLARKPYFPFVSNSHAKNIPHIAGLAAHVTLQRKRQHVSISAIFEFRLQSYKDAFHRHRCKMHFFLHLSIYRFITFFCSPKRSRIIHANPLKRPKRNAQCFKTGKLKSLPVFSSVLRHLSQAPSKPT